MGRNDTFKILQGKEFVKEYRALFPNKTGKGDPEPSEHCRSFCGECGSHLWAFHSAYEQWMCVLPLMMMIDIFQLPISICNRYIFAHAF